MVSSGTARQIHLLHDLSAPDISPTVQAMNRRWGEVTVVTYDDLDLLESMIRSYYHVEEMRNVVVICSAENTMATFEMIRTRNLESPTVQWYVVLLDNVVSELASVMREGTQVSVAVKKTLVSYGLAISFIDKKNKANIRKTRTKRTAKQQEQEKKLQRQEQEEQEQEKEKEQQEIYQNRNKSNKNEKNTRNKNQGLKNNTNKNYKKNSNKSKNNKHH
ncbi:coiled-coil domain-containing protein 34-like [Penaeus vannamei]|uniref:coiled-coil domain-containing protein 34-like n=1 Tax=Penaeus vannamei TaxID=6689 RepID=UPI00387F8F65